MSQMINFNRSGALQFVRVSDDSKLNECVGTGVVNRRVTELDSVRLLVNLTGIVCERKRVRDRLITDVRFAEGVLEVDEVLVVPFAIDCEADQDDTDEVACRACA